MALRLCKIEITLSLQSISKEVHGRAARRVKTYGIPVKLRILPPDVRSENGPFRPDTENIIYVNKNIDFVKLASDVDEGFPIFTSIAPFVL